MGFSFADEHIRELTLRVANTNPTSIIYIFVYGKDSGIYEKLKNEAKNNNISDNFFKIFFNFYIPTNRYILNNIAFI
jgi:hypothetical protein